MREHGYFKITHSGNVLISTFYGAWNKEQIEKYSESIKQEARTLTHSSWARVVDLSHWEGAGEEIIQPLNELQCWAQNHNCTAVAFVNPQFLPKFMLKKYGNIYPRFDVFPTVEQAIEYVNNKLVK